MDTHAELTCRELVELVTEYLEGGLGPRERMRFEEHLLACEGCRAYLDQMRRTIEVVGTLREDSVPSAVSDKLLEAFRAWKSGRPPRAGEAT